MIGGILDLQGTDRRRRHDPSQEHGRDRCRSAGGGTVRRHHRGKPHPHARVARDAGQHRGRAQHKRCRARTRAQPGHAHGIQHASRSLAEPWFVPETTTLEEQLPAFRERRSHFALVVDEYGALQGLITLGDILEEIFGDIPDEYTKSRTLRHPRAGRRLLSDRRDAADPRTQSRARLGSAGRRSHDHCRSRHSRSTHHPRCRPALRVSRLHVRDPAPAAQSDHGAPDPAAAAEGSGGVGALARQRLARFDVVGQPASASRAWPAA